MTAPASPHPHRAAAIVAFILAACSLGALLPGSALLNRGSLTGYLLCALCAACFGIFLLLGNGLLQKDLPLGEGRRAAKAVLWILAGVYLAALAYILFLAPAARERMTAEAYFTYGKLNLVPFATVRRYVKAIARGIIPLISVLNLAGNLLLFLPLGVLLAILPRPFCRFFCALPLMLLTIAAVEMVQLYFRIGSCDVDDLILNFIGGTAGFFLAKTKLMRRLWIKQRFMREA